METDYPGRAPRSSPISLTSVSASLSLPSPLPVLHSSLSSLPMSPSPNNSNSRRLDLLLREQAFLSSMKSSIPNAWAILDSEIIRLRTHYGDMPRMPSHHHPHHHSSLLPSLRPPPTPGKTGISGITGVTGVAGLGGPPSRDGSQALSGSRKRIKLRVPAEKYPEYNFVGRLLGPRGATLKKLERDTGCKIMIRGRGSIRKDKESEVRGKPGWEHVFNENLHVVIEVSDFHDDADANRILTRAREMVELLLVPVPEERDTLKRQQLRDLAILNGTFRATDATPPPSNLSNISQVTVSSGLVGYQSSQSSSLPRNTSPLVRADFGAATSSHSNNSNFDFPSSSSFSSSDSVLARRRAAMHAANSTSMDGLGHPSSSPARPRHGGPAAAAAATLAAAAAAGVDRSNHNSHKLKSSLPSRSFDSGLPDIGSLRIPSLDIETMSESFLVSPVGFTSLPSASPTVVDETYYPFPSTPSVGIHDRGSAFGSPIWSGPPVLSSSPLPSPSAPIRSANATGEEPAGPILPFVPVSQAEDVGGGGLEQPIASGQQQPSVPPVMSLDASIYRK